MRRSRAGTADKTRRRSALAISGRMVAAERCTLIAGDRTKILSPTSIAPCYADLEPRELRAQRLLADVAEPHDQLRVVVERLDADHRADAELRMPHLHARAQRHAGRLILVLVRVGRRLLARRAAAAAAAVRVRPELVVRRSCPGSGDDENAGATRSTSSAGTSSMKRDGSLDWYSPKTRRRAAPVSTSRARGARHADVAQPPLLLELLLVVRRSRVREQPFFEARRG